MAVCRIEKTKDYTIMSNHHLKDRRLSLKAKGLLSMMLSLPKEWDYTLKGLARISREGVDAIRQALVQQLYQPVQWTGCVQALAARGVSRVAECGPGKVLTGLVKRIDKNIEGRSLATPADFAGALDEWAN